LFTLLLPLSLFFFSLSPVLVSRESIRPEPNTFYSPGRAYRAAVEYTTGNSEFVPFSRFELSGPDGKAVYARKGDGHTVLDVSDQGRVVGVDFDGPVSGHALLHFYDLAGTEQATADVGFLDCRTFSSDGSRYAVLDGKAGLRVFSAEGAELYDLGPASTFALSGDGRVVALANEVEILLARDGKVQGRVPLASPFIRQMSLSGDGSVLAWVDRFKLRLCRVSDATVTAELAPPEPDLRFISTDVSADAALVAAGLDFDAGRGTPGRHRRGLVLLADADGNPLWQDRLEYDRWNFAVPSVRLETGDKLEVRTADLVRVYGF